jgi:hypothetical protein
MIRLISDNDVRGQFSRLLRICRQPPWREFWQGLDCNVCTFDELDLPENASDATVWRACQEAEALLITANRNADGVDSLGVTIREQNKSDFLPVLTLADPRRVLHDQEYAEAVVERLFEILMDIDLLRGTARLFMP